MTTKTLTKIEIADALRAAMAAPFAPKTGPTGGCGRAYVCVLGSKEDVKLFAAACKNQGYTFLRKAYGTGGNALYIGYDNADGIALARSEAVAAELSKRGLRCYADAVGD
jgi:hypothetical protein